MKRYVFVFVVVVAALVGGVVGSIVTLRYFDVSITPYNSIVDRQNLGAGKLSIRYLGTSTTRT